MRLQSAIFDMDGTLLDSMSVWSDTCTQVLRAQGVEPEADLNAMLCRMTLAEGADYCKAHYGLPQPAEQLAEAVRSRVEAFYRGQVRAKPGVETFLSLLKMEGVWMYVATATDRPLAEAGLRCAGIDRYFRGILTCAEVGRGKDSPEIYERAMRRLQSNKRDTVVFEDALHAVRTLSQAGFRVVGVYDAASEADQPEIRRLSELYVRSFEELYQTSTPD